MSTSNSKRENFVNKPIVQYDLNFAVDVAIIVVVMFVIQ